MQVAGGHQLVNTKTHNIAANTPGLTKAIIFEGLYSSFRKVKSDYATAFEANSGQASCT